MIKPLHIKQHDLQPVYPFGVRDSKGNPVPCTGATATFTMVNESTNAVVINRQPITWTDEANGDGEYRWQAGDTDTPGTYRVEIAVVPQTGGKFTIPANGVAYVIIEADLDKQ